jgi:hypothetical protein
VSAQWHSSSSAAVIAPLLAVHAHSAGLLCVDETRCVDVPAAAQAHFFAVHAAHTEFVCVDAVQLVRALPADAVELVYEAILASRVHDVRLLDALVRLAARDDAPERRSLAAVLALARRPGTLEETAATLWRARTHAVAARDDADDVDDSLPVPDDTADTGDSGDAGDDGDAGDLLAPAVRWVAQTSAASLDISEFERVVALRDVLRRVLAVWRQLTDAVRSFLSGRPALVREMLPDAWRRFGPLSETIQVKAAVALDTLHRRGVVVDVDALLAMERQCLGTHRALLAALVAVPAHAAVFATDLAKLLAQLDDASLSQSARVALCAKPRMNASALRALLLETVIGEIRAAHGIDVLVPQNSAGEMLVSLTAWQMYAPRHAFVERWLALFRSAKLLGWLAQLERCVDAPSRCVYPQWTVLKRNGRSGCGAPNMQATPRAPGCRELFRARPQHAFLCIDYSFIELCTLAAVCERRYGRSALADTIRRGVDPHSHTAAAFENMSVEQFEAARRTDRRLDAVRQKAKAINFGIPGGEGVDALRDYVAANYGIAMTADEAEAYRERVITEIYPELELYLADDSLALLVDGLGCTADELAKQFNLSRKAVDPAKFARTLLGIRHVIQGRLFRADGYPFKRSFLAKVWKGLAELNRREHLRPLIERFDGGDELYAQLYGARVTTLTGRVRGGVSYTQARNTPFSGLAADGAKLALWDLVHSGYHVVAFVHDELLIELPLEPRDAPYARTAQHAQTVERILVDAMASVCGDIPIRCEYALCLRWSKQLKATYNARGELIPCDDAAAE